MSTCGRQAVLRPRRKIYGDEELVLRLSIEVETSETVCYNLSTSV